MPQFNSKQTQFDSVRAKKLTLTITDYRVPLRNELFVNKLGKLSRQKDYRNFSRRANKRLIVKEDFDATINPR